MIRECQKAMVMAAEAGISVELIDLRTIYPIDKETIRDSIRKTGRVVIVAEAPQSFSVGSELIAIANEEAFLYLEAPPKRVMGFDTIVPYAKGEAFYMISPDRIFYELEKTVKF
jgi:pyruvate dehydrogenase E1 component beta subunit